jgi:fluoride ion exporter CrcB/FEX
VQQLYADTASVVRDKATESPLGTLALVAVASFLMGVLWSNSGSDPAPKEYPRES